MSDDNAPVIGALIEELFALGIMIEMIAADTGTVDSLIGKCRIAVGNCRTLAASLHPEPSDEDGPTRLQ